MLFNSFKIFLLVFVSIQCVVVVKRPSYLPTCYRNDPQFSECLLKATDEVRPYLEKGIPELKVPSFKRFAVSEINLEQDGKSLNFKAHLQNVILEGLTQYKFSQFVFDPNTLQLYTNLTLDSIKLEGNYQLNGRILVMVLDSKGDFTAKIDSAEVYWYQEYEKFTSKDGKTYLRAKASNSIINVKKPQIYFTNLFKNNDELTEATNKAINDNSEELFGEVKPVIELTITKVFNDILMTAFLRLLPYDEVFPINPDIK